MKKNISGSKVESEHFSKILMEKMDSTVKTVTEQYGSLVKKIDEVRNDIGDLKEDMAIVKPVVEASSKDLKEIKSELHSVSMAIVDVSHEAKILEKRIKKLEEKVLI